MKSFLFVFTLASFILFSGCSKSEPGAKLVPSNLTVDIVVDNNQSGNVTFTATATNASQFTFTYDEPGVAPEKSYDGIVTHKYAESGTYDIKVVATSRDNISTDISQTIEVTVAGPSIPVNGYSTPDHYDGMTLVWKDEFGGTALNTLDWNFESGNNNGWGNNELEYYQAANTTVADGYLVIEARKETVGGFNYTSSRLTTAGKQFFKYGRIDIRAALPKGQGIWPALWMLGESITKGTNWPACGEIDIMELIGGGAGRDNMVYGTSHWSDASNNHQMQGGNKALASPATFADEFHVFTVIWDEANIKYYVDDALMNTTPVGSDAAKSEFKADFFLIFNVAVGGAWPGNPNASTVFPQRMTVDYVRVFQ